MSCRSNLTECDPDQELRFNKPDDSYIAFTHPAYVSALQTAHRFFPLLFASYIA